MQCRFRPFFMSALISMCFYSCELRTECLTGMTACSDDGGSTLRCDKGFWVGDEACGHGLTCSMMEGDSTGHDHSGLPAQGMAMCMSADHADHHEEGDEHTAGEHAAGEHTAGEHAAGSTRRRAHGERAHGERAHSERAHGE